MLQNLSSGWREKASQKPIIKTDVEQKRIENECLRFYHLKSFLHLNHLSKNLWIILRFPWNDCRSGRFNRWRRLKALMKNTNWLMNWLIAVSNGFYRKLAKLFSDCFFYLFYPFTDPVERSLSSEFGYPSFSLLLLVVLCDDFVNILLLQLIVLLLNLKNPIKRINTDQIDDERSSDSTIY